MEGEDVLQGWQVHSLQGRLTKSCCFLKVEFRPESLNLAKTG